MRIFLSVFLVSFKIYGSSLTFLKNGEKISAITLNTFKSSKNIIELEVQNIWRKHKKTYIGQDFYFVLDSIYGHSWKGAKSIKFKSVDGYTQTSIVSAMLKSSKNKTGLIAISEKGTKGFTSFIKGNKLVNPGPFYLVWTNFSENDKSSHGKILKWPYQLKSVDIKYE